MVIWVKISSEISDSLTRWTRLNIKVVEHVNQNFILFLFDYVAIAWTYSVDQKSGYCRRSSLTVDRIENLMAHYEVQLLILPTRAPFRLKIPTYLSKRIFFKISESGLQNKKFIE